MTQRKIPQTTANKSGATKSGTTKSGTTKTATAKKAGRRLASPANQYLTRFQESLLQGSTPGPVKQRSDCDPRQTLDHIYEHRNRLRSWSYKGVGI